MLVEVVLQQVEEEVHLTEQLALYAAVQVALPVLMQTVEHREEE